MDQATEMTAEVYKAVKPISTETERLKPASLYMLWHEWKKLECRSDCTDEENDRGFDRQSEIEIEIIGTPAKSKDDLLTKVALMRNYIQDAEIFVDHRQITLLASIEAGILTIGK